MFAASDDVGPSPEARHAPSASALSSEQALVLGGGHAERDPDVCVPDWDDVGHDAHKSFATFRELVTAIDRRCVSGQAHEGVSLHDVLHDRAAGGRNESKPSTRR